MFRFGAQAEAGRAHDLKFSPRFEIGMGPDGVTRREGGIPDGKPEFERTLQILRAIVGPRSPKTTRLRCNFAWRSLAGKRSRPARIRISLAACISLFFDVAWASLTHLSPHSLCPRCITSPSPGTP